MINTIVILIGKLLSLVSKTFNLGSGSTWPGHIALERNKSFIKDIIKRNPQLVLVVVAGTNGKTTTATMLQTILEKTNHKVFQNKAGANLLNGIASSFIDHSNMFGRIPYEFAIFEVDENALPHLLQELTPNFIVLLNLFRDQLDRYGEVDSIARRWKKALVTLPKKSTLILNADDPQIAFLRSGFKGKVLFYGLQEEGISHFSHQHASDSTYCLYCNAKLVYDAIYFSHVGIWHCRKCGRKRPMLDLTGLKYYPLRGAYNKYNTLAAVLTAKAIGINTELIEQSLNLFVPAFGRQEKIEVDGKKVQIYLSKNPASFNESLRTIMEPKAKNVLFILNDRIPDGRDVSWIWDVDFEDFLPPQTNIVVSGDRAHDMGLRMKYSESSKFQIEEDLKSAISLALEQTPIKETLYILPTYSAMLEVRKILTGRKIL